MPGMAETKKAVKLEQVTVTVSAALGLKEPLLIFKSSFEKQNPNTQIDFNWGALGALRRQMEEGAPVDLFLSADTKNLDMLNQQHLLKVGSQKVILGNTLVLLVDKKLEEPVYCLMTLYQTTLNT